ncbi:hypothetical protein GCK72_002671 [Caenorhabditis remanei]|uniref:Fucosyltransferase n=1 Tax=Caenorhabditis remanei TaxID=31234 RepID=A0A6A5HWT5_CAERE|nr:hypothetical protein GCK72_002671 [Caenorhabditis remanei]KAF1770847.1 hypothetical protein GCK72_002671 [Caenorhabditis remanei]
MTYRRDSDVHHPYGALVKNEKFVNLTEIWNSKTKEAIWLNNARASSRNRRVEFTEKLKSEGMNIDLMGNAFNNTPKECPRFARPPNCTHKLLSPYKFYIAFENSNCEDYVTEKFWEKAGWYNMVPIVFERKIYRNLGIPDEMYIAVNDFQNLEDFISFVKSVSSNKDKYLKYHQWRKQYRIIESSSENYGFCQLCQKLLKFRGLKLKEKSYANLKDWYSTPSCDNSFVDKYLQ